uniref:PX domain-containing protein n=1 Tax=Fagus sylvatica TaxID=28930 RepID=A0A2N9HVE2_FAGSY
MGRELMGPPLKSLLLSSHPSDQPKSDGADAASPVSVSSQYSSCGESDFERYCSANSAMGTPSMCSSTITTFNDCVESELFASMRNLGFGGDDSGLESFSLGGRFDTNQEDRRVLGGVSNPSLGTRNVEIPSDLRGFVELSDDGSGKSECGEEGSIGSREHEESRVENVSCKESEGNLFGDGVGEGSSSRVVSGEDGGCYDGMNMQFDFEVDGTEREREEEDDGASSRYEHSEGEDSMYGTDDEGKDHFYVQRNLGYVREARAQNENPLLINSSVAFGSEDWDDFAQEMEGSMLASLTLDAFQDQNAQDPETEGNLLNSNSEISIGISSADQIDQGQVVTEMALADDIDGCSLTPTVCLAEPETIEDVRGIPEASYQVQGGDELLEHTKNASVISSGFSNLYEPEQEHVRDTTVTKNQVRDSEKPESSVSNVSQIEPEQIAEGASLDMDLNNVDSGMEREHQCVNTKEVIGAAESRVLSNQDVGKSKVKLDLFDVIVNQPSSNSTVSPENINLKLFHDHETLSSASAFEHKMRIVSNNSPVSADLSEDHIVPLQTENLDINEFYDEVVHEMEEILLDSCETPGTRFSQDNRMFQSHLSLPLRDGGSTASTSGTDDVFPLIQHPLRIDGVEVVGARQKKGNVSFSERLVGVKEYTVYKIKVWSGKDQWEVERRYRDFFTLYRRLKTTFADQDLILPPPWFSVEKESRKIFGNASPDVIAERSGLIQECLRSILHSRIFSSTPTPLIWFLSPQDSFPSSPMSKTLVPQSTSFARRPDTENVSTLGKTISLIVEIQPYKSMKQMLEAQHYTCAGCHKHFDDGKTLMLDFVQTFGWGKPRLCEYTGQLYCSSCHTNETAVLPARVLHQWDFTQYLVSQMAKSYLDSIHDQPMLCVSAVNPFLFSKVPALLHVMGVRKKIGTMLPYVHCPFRRTINKGLGSRRYLLESNDFFALRDLIDLSKGAFAALPVMVETVSRKILEHITEQCLICCDVGVPCSARQACDDPSALIFPFQEGEVERCTSCESLFHKACFRKLTNCPCGAQLRADWVSNGAGGEGNRALGRRSSSGLSAGLLSGLFAKAKPEKMKELKDGDNVILMGSMPSTSLL